MFDLLAGVEEPSVDSLIAVLAIADATGTDAGAIDRIGDLERLKAAAAAAQARIAAELLDRAEEAHAGRCAAQSDQAAQAALAEESWRRDPRGPVRSVAAQIALARRESPHRGRELLGLARLLATDLPHLRRLVEDGQVSEHRAHVIATQLRDLPPAQRREADTRLAGPTPTSHPPPPTDSPALPAWPVSGPRTAATPRAASRCAWTPTAAQPAAPGPAPGAASGPASRPTT